MVLPNRVIENRNWRTNTGIDILLALGEGEGLYIYTEFLDDNFIEMGMPFEVVNCELSVRTNSIYARPLLVMEFFLQRRLVAIFILPVTIDWVTHALTVNRWDSVLISTSGEGPEGTIVAIDFLRANPLGRFPTKRTLTGVGV